MNGLEAGKGSVSTPPKSAGSATNAPAHYGSFSFPTSSPGFDNKEISRREANLAQREAEQHQQEHDDQASDAMSQDGVAPLPQGIPHEWSTTASSTSTATRNMTRRQKEIEKLRQGTLHRPTRGQTRRNPYFTF